MEFKSKFNIDDKVIFCLSGLEAGIGYVKKVNITENRKREIYVSYELSKEPSFMDMPSIGTFSEDLLFGSKEEYMEFISDHFDKENNL